MGNQRQSWSTAVRRLRPGCVVVVAEIEDYRSGDADEGDAFAVVGQIGVLKFASNGWTQSGRESGTVFDDQDALAGSEDGAFRKGEIDSLGKTGAE